MGSPPIKPQLPEDLPLDQVERTLNRGSWYLSQKLDGHRKMVYVIGTQVLTYNRHGDLTSLPLHIEQQLSRAAEQDLRYRNLILDGELVGNTLWLFDMPYSKFGKVTPDIQFFDRLSHLDSLFWPEVLDLEPYHDMKAFPNVGLVEHYNKTDDQFAAIGRMMDRGVEGVVLHSINAPYISGKRTHWVRKAKFIKSVDCVVVDKNRNGKQNLTLAVYDNGRLVEVCDCTALAGSKDKIQVGDVVSVQTLYSTADRHLYQPSRPILRDDKRPEECTMDQLDAIRTDKTVLTT